MSINSTCKAATAYTLPDLAAIFVKVNTCLSVMAMEFIPAEIGKFMDTG